MEISNLSADELLQLYHQTKDTMLQQINEENNADAMENAEISLQLAMLLREPLLIAYSLNHIGLLSFRMGYQREKANMDFGRIIPESEIRAYYNRALECYNESLRINRAYKGHDCLEAATIIANMGSFFCQVEQYKDAEICLKEALRIKEIRLPAEHPSLATTRQTLVLLYQRLGEYDKASKLIDEGLKFTEQESWLPRNI